MGIRNRATYDSPDDLCDLHWAWWWTSSVKRMSQRLALMAESLHIARG